MDRIESLYFFRHFDVVTQLSQLHSKFGDYLKVNAVGLPFLCVFTKSGQIAMQFFVSQDFYEDDRLIGEQVDLKLTSGDDLWPRDPTFDQN